MMTLTMSLLLLDLLVPIATDMSDLFSTNIFIMLSSSTSASTSSSLIKLHRDNNNNSNNKLSMST
jgi:hypothetical protein